MVADGVVLFRRCMDDGRILMCETRQVYTILLRIQYFVVSMCVSWSVAAHRSGASRNLLAGFAIVQAERLVLRRCDDLVATVIEAEASDLSDVWGMLWSAWKCSWRRWRGWFDGLLEDLCRLQPRLQYRLVNEESSLKSLCAHHELWCERYHPICILQAEGRDWSHGGRE